MFWFETSHPETDERLEVEAVYHGARRGSRDRYGASMEPDDAEEVVICHVWNQAGKPVDFSDFEEDLITRALGIIRRG